MAPKRQNKGGDFEKAVEESRSSVTAYFMDDAIHVHSDPATSNGEMAQAFLTVAAAVATDAGMAPAEFARYARAYALRAARLRAESRADLN